MKTEMQHRKDWVMFLLVIIACLAVIIWMLSSWRDAPMIETRPVFVHDTIRPVIRVVVAKQQRPGFAYTMRAQTGAKSITMPAWQPGLFRVEVLTDSAGKASFKWLTVDTLAYARMQKGEHL